MNILIPMAGKGSRFGSEHLPKPLIDINGHPMIFYAVLSLDVPGNYIYITRKYDDCKLNQILNDLLNDITPNCNIIEIDYLTEGPASSALLAKDYINNDEPLIIANCDQILKWNSSDFINSLSDEDMDGLVITWNKIALTESFIELDENGFGIRLREKEIISDHPLNGIHFWKKGKYFVESAKQMIKENIRVNNEFYVSMTYNKLIEKGYKIKTYKLKSGQHFSVGRTEDLKKFIQQNGTAKWKFINYPT